MPEKPWLAEYPASVPAEIDAGTYASLADLLEYRFSELAERPAFSNRGTALSFGEVDALSKAFAAYLQSVPGLERGDRVAVMLPNLLQTPIVVFGILRAGMVVVNVNPMYTARELRHQLVDSESKVVIVLENFAATLASVVAATSVETVVVTSVGDQHPTPKRCLIDFVVRHVKRLVPKADLESVRYRRAIAAGSRLLLEDPGLGPEDLAFLQYTGGTTGVAKGAMLTHGNMVANVLQMTSWARPFFDWTQGVVVTPLPLYHVFALTVSLLGFTELGGHNLLITDPRDLRGFVQELSRQPFAFLIGVNTLFNALLHAPGFSDLDFSNFRNCLAGGMAVQRDVADRWKEVTGNVIAQGYGLTEASPVVTANRLDSRSFSGSIGLPLPSTDVGIFDDDGVRLPTGESGEICVRGPQVMRGYWRRPDETAKVMFDGTDWLRTGDIGRIDERGYVFIEDRKKDVIVVSGFKVFPNELEDVITQHPGVLEAAAIGVPDPKSEQAIKVFVVRKDPSLGESELIEHCRQHLTGYKIPRIVEFREALPKSNVGKVLRRVLQEESAA